MNMNVSKWTGRCQHTGYIVCYIKNGPVSTEVYSSYLGGPNGEQRSGGDCRQTHPVHTMAGLVGLLPYMLKESLHFPVHR